MNQRRKIRNVISDYVIDNQSITPPSFDTFPYNRFRLAHSYSVAFSNSFICFSHTLYVLYTRGITNGRLSFYKHHNY